MTSIHQLLDRMKQEGGSLSLLPDDGDEWRDVIDGQGRLAEDEDGVLFVLWPAPIRPTQDEFAELIDRQG